jgi:hypothetical protein
MLRTQLTELFGLTRPTALAPLGAGTTSGHLTAVVKD